MLPLSAARPWSQLTPVQALVACDPTLPEPNYPVMVELADMIKSKKANSARDATHALLGNINSRNPNQSLLGLAVLDHLVKNGGYPIHLQIATKEFLNELVRRFPERPPMVTGRVMGRILEMIHEWKNTLCVHSKYKEDLVHIRDMHRLLSYKGYRFKSFDAARAMASANPNEDLKSPEELEEEDRAAKSAKLQELIRRGNPRDLAAAQELMKYLAGAEPDKTVDYTTQTLNELDKVQSKAILLNDMLNNAREGEKVGIEGDAYEQVAMACRGARPKIQKWIEQDTGEREGMMERLLLCNDLINTALERYEACRVGDWSKAQALVEAHNPNKKAADLISFDAFADDEGQMSMSGDGGLSLPSDSNASSSAPPTATATAPGGLPLDLFSAPSPTPSPGPSFFSQTSSSSQVQRQDPMAFFNTPSQPQAPAQRYGPSATPDFFGSFGSGSNQGQGQGSSSPYGGFQPQQSTQQRPPQQQQQGYSIPTPTMQPTQANQQNRNTNPSQNQNQNQNQNQQQQKKPDAFADLVDLMS